MKKVLIGTLGLHSSFKLVRYGGAIYRILLINSEYVFATRNNKNMIAFKRDYEVFI